MTVAPAPPDTAEASVREFRKGHIPDLSLDRDHQDAWLRKHPVTDEASLRPLEDRIADQNEAVIYRGPFREVRDDDGHVFCRGQRVAVCRKTFEILTREPYEAHFEAVTPLEAVEEPVPFDCAGVRLRHPKETKRLDYDVTTEAACGPNGCC